jgi:Flp pilus assembly protein CpaB
MGRRTIVLVIALLLAVVSGFAIWRYLSSIESEIRADIQEVRVYRTTELIATGTPGVEAEALIVEGTALRESVVFDGSTVLCLGPAPHNEGGDPNEVGCPINPNDLSQTIANRVAAGPISAQQVITQDQWVSPAEIADIKLSESLAEGKVAIAFRPDEVAAVGGFIRPGDKINLVGSQSIPVVSLEVLQDEELREVILGGLLFEATVGEGIDEEGRTVESLLGGSLDFTQTFMQEVKVIAVGPDTLAARIPTGLTPQGSQIIILEVTPAQAETIEFAKTYITISTMLLPFDIPYTPFDSIGVVVNDLFSIVDKLKELLRDSL